MADWYVQVVETETGNVERQIGCWSERDAEKVERGLLRNMNTDRYHTSIIDKDSTND